MSCPRFRLHLSQVHTRNGSYFKARTCRRQWHRASLSVNTYVLTTPASPDTFPSMAAKSAQLQIRVTPRQKAALKRQARAAGLDVSTYVLARVLPPERDRFADLLRELGSPADHRFALAELHDFLAASPPMVFAEALQQTAFTANALAGLSPLLQNYVAAMVEQSAAQKSLMPPVWVRDVLPLDAPYFAGALRSLRQYLLAVSPVPFKRRNLFVDATIGDRV